MKVIFERHQEMEMLRPVMSDESHQYFLVVSLGHLAVHYFIGLCFVVRLVGICQFCSCDQ